MLSKTSQYAIRAALELTKVPPSGPRIGVSELAENLQVPQPFLAKVLQQLVKSGIISSVKGPKGGFYLTTQNRKHTLADIVRLFDGDAFFTGCILGLESCSANNPCPLHVQFAAYREGLSFHLRNQTIATIARHGEKEDNFYDIKQV